MAVVAFIDATSSSSPALQYAAWAARALEQSLVLVAVTDAGDNDATLTYEALAGMNAREDMYREMIAIERSEAPFTETAAIEMVQGVARSARELGVERVRTIISSDPMVYFIEHSTSSADLLVFGRNDRDDAQPGKRLEEILHVRKRAMLLVPDTFSEPKSWLIALDGGSSSGRAVDYLIHNPLVRGIPGTAAIVGADAQHRIHFRDAVKHLQSAGYEMTPHELQGGVDDVLPAVMTVAPVDLLVMGAFGKGRFRSLFERSTTSRLLHSFHGPVLVTRS